MLQLTSKQVAAISVHLSLRFQYQNSPKKIKLFSPNQLKNHEARQLTTNEEAKTTEQAFGLN